jgi:hypothetical protein
MSSDTDPARVVDVFVDGLELFKLGFVRVEPAVTGRPPYHPSVLLKLYIYGYLDRLQSSRRLEKEAQRNVELMWLTGRLTPDFKTIATTARTMVKPSAVSAGSLSYSASNSVYFQGLWWLLMAASSLCPRG